MGRRRCRPLNQTRVVTGGRPRREMGTGEAAVPPRETSGRRYKALTPWRFQRGFVRKQAKSPAAAPRGRGGAPVGGSGAKRSRSASVVGSGGRSAGDGGARPSLPTWSLASPRPLHQATRARAPPPPPPSQCRASPSPSRAPSRWCAASPDPSTTGSPTSSPCSSATR
ncbi:hypothetical protein ACQJBY_025687 [Aegilops geniculata]